MYLVWLVHRLSLILVSFSVCLSVCLFISVVLSVLLYCLPHKANKNKLHIKTDITSVVDPLQIFGAQTALPRPAFKLCLHKLINGLLWSTELLVMKIERVSSLKYRSAVGPHFKLCIDAPGNY